MPQEFKLENDCGFTEWKVIVDGAGEVRIVGSSPDHPVQVAALVISGESLEVKDWWGWGNG